MTDPRMWLAWLSLVLLLIITAAKLAAGYYAASATSRLGNSAAQRGIAYGVLLPGVAYILIVVAAIPADGLDYGERTVAFLLGMLILAVSGISLAWGWRRYDAALGEVFGRDGLKILAKREDKE